MSNRLSYFVGSTAWSLFVMAITFASGLFTFVEPILGVPDISEDFLVGCILALLGHFIILFGFRRTADANRLQLSWSIKIFVTLTLSIFYELHYQTLDAFNYFHEGTSKRQLTFGIRNGTYHIIEIVKGLDLVGLSYYNADKVIFSFLGMLGLFMFYKSICVVRQVKECGLFFYAIMLFPSTLFWSSILGKDPLIIFALGLYCFSLVNCSYSLRIFSIFSVIASIFLVGLIRTWVPLILCMPTAYVIYSSRIFSRFAFLRIATISVAVAALFFLLNDLMGISSAAQLLNLVKSFSVRFNSGTSGQYYADFTSYGDLLRFLPVGMFTTLFRPLPGELATPFGVFAGIENTLLIAMLITSIGLLKIKRAEYRMLNFIFIYLIGFMLAYSLVSPFNLGTGFRFRAQATPFLLMMIMLSVDWKQLSVAFRAKA